MTSFVGFDRMIERPEVKGSLKIPLEMIPEELMQLFLDPMRALPIMKIQLTRVQATDGIAMQIGWEGSYTEFEFVAETIQIEKES